MEATRSEHQRKTITGVCMIAAPIALLASDALWPVTSTGVEDMVADATGHTGQVYGAVMLGVLGFMLLTGAVLGLAHLLHERRPTAALVGGAMALGGIVAGAAAYGAIGMLMSEVVGVSRGALLLDDVMNRTGPLFLLSMFIGIGMIVLAVGLTRAEVVAPWTAYCIIAAAIGISIGNAATIKPLILAAEIAMLAGLGTIGYQVLSETDEEWVHTPTFHGFGGAVTA
jgi:hypothetical protein